MKQNRKSLKTKMHQALYQEIKGLPIGAQEILIDDLITAFENRYVIISTKRTILDFNVMTGLKVSQ